MIRMNLKMALRAAEQTDRLAAALDPDGTEGLLVLIAQTRAANGSIPVKEHDFQAVLERLRRDGGGRARPPDGVSGPDLRRALADLIPANAANAANGGAP